MEERDPIENAVRVNYPLKKGTEIFTKIKNYQDFTGTNVFLFFGIINIEGEQINNIKNIKIEEATDFFSFIIPEDATAILMWIGIDSAPDDRPFELVSYLSSTITGEFCNRFEDIETSIENTEDSILNLKKNTRGFSLSILSDSYSTFKKWIPEGYATWYSEDGNTAENDVPNVTYTWWWKLLKETGMSLLVNSSYSGSTVCNTGYSGADSSRSSFITRMKKDIGEDKNISCKPDVIIILGGTNDSWADSPIGNLKYDGWTDEDLKQFSPAFCYMLHYLKLWNPGCRIINVINEELKTEIESAMTEACTYNNVECLKLSGIEKQNGHPSINGMEAIKNQIKNIL